VRHVLFAALTVALGGFLLGFDAAVISGVAPFLARAFDLAGPRADLQLGWAVSSLGWGALAGNLAAGSASDHFGRKRVLMAAAVLFLASALLAAFAGNLASFVVARLLGGLAVGAAILIAPVYIAEIAPATRRGALVSLNQLMMVTGISASFFSNYALLAAGEQSWRWMLGVQAAPAALYLVLLWFVPESPRWRRPLPATSGPVWARWRGLVHPRRRFVMLLALALAFFQQATGINAVFYYLPTIFVRAGGGTPDAFRQAVLVGLVNVGMTFVAIALVDRVGRKPLLVLGGAGMAVSLFAVGWAFRAAPPALDARTILAGLIGFVAAFAVSWGPVTWVLLSEMFPNESRGTAVSVAGFWNALVSAAVTLLFPWQLATIGPAATFLLYGAFAVAALVVVGWFVPETRGRTLEELQALSVAPQAARTGSAPGS
jgi:SP family arabinose:H+ symporter-like MFS transporter